MSWTPATTSLDDAGGQALGGCWSEDLEEFAGVGQDGALTKAIIQAANGIDWTDKPSPFDGGVGRGIVRRPALAFAGPWMKADAAVADAYAQIDLGSDEADVWVTFTLLVDAAAVRLWATSGFWGYFSYLIEPEWGPFLNAGKWPDSSYAFAYKETLVEMHFEEGVLFQIYVDGVLVEDDVDGGPSLLRNIAFGLYGASDWAAGSVAYMKDIVAGTTRGGNDLFDANIASGNLSAFTSTSGDVSVVSEVTSDAVYVAAGLSGDSLDTIITSPDLDTWTRRGNPFLSLGYGTAAAVRNSDGALLVAGGNNAADQLGISLDDGATWTRYQPLEPGETARCVCVRQSDDLIVVGGERCSVSSDGGANWTQTTPFAAIYGCAIRESDGAIVIVGSDGGPLKVAISTDDGASWTTTATDPFAAADLAYYGADVAIRSSDDAIVISGDGAGLVQVAISTNGGTTWTASSPFGATGFALSVALRPSDEAIIVGGLNFGTNESVAISTTSGASWTAYDLSAQGITFVAAVAVRASDDAIFVYTSSDLGSTEDGGTTWNNLGRPLPLSGSLSGGLAIRQSDNALVVTTTGTPWNPHAAVSLDSAATWLTSSPFSVVPGSGFSVAVKPSTGRVIVGGSMQSANGSIAFSDDAVVFTNADAGGPSGVDVIGIDYSPGGDFWMAVTASNDVWTSIDDGYNWSLVSNPMTNTSGVYRDETNGRWWLLGQTSGGFSLAYSEDDGATWVEVSTPLDGGLANAMVNCGAAGLSLGGIDSTGQQQMCTSEDAGDTWAFDGESPAPYGPGGTVHALAYSPTIPLAVAFGGIA